MNVNICKIYKKKCFSQIPENLILFFTTHAVILQKCRFEFNQITDIIELTADLVFICCILTQVHIHVNMHVLKCILISNCSLIQYVNQYAVQIVKNYETDKTFFLHLIYFTDEW